nr:DUF2442 domain-containing protein [Duganella aceris]
MNNATQEQRAEYIFSGNGKGLHWDALNEDISVEHLLLGHKDSTVNRINPRLSDVK